MLNDKMDNIMKKFHQAMPNRRPTDYAFIAYIVAGFEPKTIAVLLDIGVNTVYTVDSNVDFPQIVIEKGATKRGIQR